MSGLAGWLDGWTDGWQRGIQKRAVVKASLSGHACLYVCLPPSASVPPLHPLPSPTFCHLARSYFFDRPDDEAPENSLTGRSAAVKSFAGHLSAAGQPKGEPTLQLAMA